MKLNKIFERLEIKISQAVVATYTKILLKAFLFYHSAEKIIALPAL